MRGRNIPVEVRNEILRVYQRDGIDAAGKLAVLNGLTYRYPSKIASRYGVPHKRSRKYTAAEKAAFRNRGRRDDSNDPRWAWAIERGAVVI